jgi:phosphoglycolate phosphatase-like HAD superfamily hydrolase
MSLDLRRVRAICFDVDGTLSDTDDRWVQRLDRALRPLRWVFPAGDTGRFSRWVVMGLDAPGNLAYTLLDRLHLDDEAGRLINRLSRRKKDHPDPFLIVPGVSEMLARLGPSWPLAVVSARGERSTLAFLDQFGLRSHFGAIATALTCLYTKPFPDPIHWAAERLRVPPEDCLMVGDTVVDIRAGKAAGAQTVGVLCGFGSRRELSRAGADLILDSTADLAGVLLEGG